MPLSKPSLKSGLLGACSNPGDSPAACAAQWAAAVRDFAAALVPPSVSVAAAASTLESALSAAFASAAAAPLMENAFAAFGATVALGQAPTFAGVPPTAPVGFAARFAGPMPETHDDAASAVANLIDAWMKTGTATMVAPPNTVLTWS